MLDIRYSTGVHRVCRASLLSESRERNNRSPSCGDTQCHTGDLQLIQPPLLDTDRPGSVNSSKKQSCVNSILPVQCPAASEPGRGAAAAAAVSVLRRPGPPLRFPPERLAALASK